MTLLSLSAGDKRYGIDVRAVESVVPLPRLTPIALTPPWVAGIFPFFGQLVPVVDLCLLHGNRPARHRLGTRVVVTRYTLADTSVRALGLLAEDVTDIVEGDDNPGSSGLSAGEAPWLGGLVDTRESGLVQVVNPADLLTAEVRALLFPT